MSSDRRKHKRYNVENVSELQCAIESQPLNVNMLTFGSGGCGFWIADNPKYSLQVGQTIKCILTLDSQSAVKVHAEIVCSYPYPFGREIGKFVGVKFLEDELYRIKPIMDNLGALESEGRIQVARRS